MRDHVEESQRVRSCMPADHAGRHIAGDTLLHLGLRDAQCCSSFPSNVVAGWSLGQLTSLSSTRLHVPQDLEALVGVRRSAEAQGCAGGELKYGEFLQQGRAWLGVLGTKAKLGRFLRAFARHRAGVVLGKT